MDILLVVILVIGGLVAAALVMAKGLIYNCSPSEVLVFYGGRHSGDGRTFGYRLIKGGTGLRRPLIEQVDRLDLSNMAIEVSAANAYCKGGIPVSVHGVANLKIAGHEPVIHNAIERFLTVDRESILVSAKQVLEGSLRGILSTLTPEQINEDRILFAERLVHEVENDMTSLGLVVDTLKIQNVHDEVKYLDSIGRRRSAEVVSYARIAETRAKADSVQRQAENLEQETRARIDADTAIAKAEVQRRLADTVSQRAAVIAEQQGIVQAQLARAEADLLVQRAREAQVRGQLEADVIQPAKAACEVAERMAQGIVAPIVENGRARAEGLRSLAQAWRSAGPNAKQVLVTERIVPIVEALSASVAATRIERVTIIGSPNNGTNSLPAPASVIAWLEQFKQVFGVDLAEQLRRRTGETPTDAPKP